MSAAAIATEPAMSAEKAPALPVEAAEEEQVVNDDLESEKEPASDMASAKTSTTDPDFDSDIAEGTGFPEVPTPPPPSDENKTALKILFLSSDTGGGHRASSESLAAQFQLLYPGSTYILHDVVDGEKSAMNYFGGIARSYRHLSAHPSQWKLLYEVTNSRAFEMIADANLKLLCEKQTRRRIMAVDPDVVISVHPIMTTVPQLSCAKISQETGKHIPIFTVVTDLGSAHCLWFANQMEKMFVGSDQIYELAQKRGNVPDEKLVKIGLPIRHDFSLQAELLQDRMSQAGKNYQKCVRQDLNLPYTDRAVLLVMGGGEGVGSLSEIVNNLYVELVMNGIDAIVLVVCGRNEKLQTELDERNWQDILRIYSHMKTNKGSASFSNMCGPSTPAAGCIEGGMTRSIRKILSSSSLSMDPALTAPVPEEKKEGEQQPLTPPPTVTEGVPTPPSAKTNGDDDDEQQDPPPPQITTSYSFDGDSMGKPPGQVEVIGLGFVSRMAEYMVAADILVSKAGPGTISEAAAVSLPVMLTSFLPGQEEGNVDYVVDGGFGSYCNDKDPAGIAEEVVMWLTDEIKMTELSRAAGAHGAPYAARDIAAAIGDSTLKWKEINEENGKTRIVQALADQSTGK